MQTKNTTELAVGDIVNHYGMRILLDTEPIITPHNGLDVFHFPGRVLNLPEVLEEGIVPAGWLYTWKWDGGWVVDRRDAFAVQGNELARWAVEIPATGTAPADTGTIEPAHS